MAEHEMSDFNYVVNGRKQHQNVFDGTKDCLSKKGYGDLKIQTKEQTVDGRAAILAVPQEPSDVTVFLDTNLKGSLEVTVNQRNDHAEDNLPGTKVTTPAERTAIKECVGETYVATRSALSVSRPKP